MADTFPKNTIDDNGLKKVWDMVIDKLGLKVDKEVGKGLSTNDYTTTEKNKLAGIESGAEVNTVTSVVGKTGAVTLDKSDVGLPNVGNFKAVSTSANQGLTDTEKSNARANIDTPSNGDIQSSKTLKSSVVTVTDAAPINAEDITVDITPIQDLHGYDRPWAGGGWKNKLPMTVAGIKAANTGGTWSGNVCTVNGVAYTIQTDSNGNVTGIKANGTSSSDWNIFTVGTISLGAGTYKVSGITGGAVGTYRMIVNPLGGTEITFYSGDTTLTLTETTEVTVRIGIRYANVQISNVMFYPMIRLATETDATFAPYSNICPIEGRTGAELDRVGKNWFDKLSVIEGKGINDYGDIVSSNYSCVSDYIRVTPNTDYYLSTYNDGGTRRVGFYDTNKNAIGVSSPKAGSRGFTTPSNCSYCRVSIGYNYEDTQLELGTTATTYEPYQGKQYTASFGETVHGGKWHVTEGGTDKTHANIANYNGETINEPWLSSMDEYVAGATPTTGAQVVYPLTTPTAISTPKQNVPMLQGINTVYADCGDTQLKYQPDNVVGELKGEIQVANSFVSKMALREGSGAKDFSYGGWSFRIRIFRSMGQISLYVENISASNVTEQAIVKVFMGDSDYRAPEELRPRMNIVQAATYTTPSGWAIQVYLKDDGYIMFTGIAPEVGASAPTRTNWNLVEPWLAHQQAMDLFNN